MNKQKFKTKFQSRSKGYYFSGRAIRRKLNNEFKKKIIPTNRILPLEKVFKKHLENVTRMILIKKVMNRPLIIDKKYKIVLDGSHRYALLYSHGYVCTCG